MKYIILSDSYIEDLEDSVNDAISKGYDLYGSPAPVNSKHGLIIYQAMVKGMPRPTQCNATINGSRSFAQVLRGWFK